MPSEDGPYCDTSKLIENPHDFSKLYPIVVEDIENDVCPLDNKKANFSLKYSDFLTNSETPESSFLKTEDDKLKITQCTDLADINFILGNNLDEKLSNISISQVLDNVDLFNDKLTAIKSNTRNFQQAYPVLIVPPFSQITNSGTIKNNEHPEIIMCSTNNNVKNISNTSKIRPKVRIISEKKITEPVSLKGHFKSISPSIVVNPGLNQDVQQTNDVTMMQMVPDNVSLNQTKPVNLIEIDVNMHEPIILQNQTPLPEQPTQNITPQNNTLNENSTKSVENSKSLLKKKTPSKRIAAIQEKRNFNKKLKKDQQSQSVQMEESKSVEVKQIENEKSQEKVQTPKMDTAQNGDYLSRLEARMSRMENLLLNKIDQNSQKIIDLKQTFRTSTQKNKNISTQTNENDAVYKKYLFREISEYLSSETKNLLYEELFINEQFAQKPNLRSRVKQRRFR